ncbi:HNH endonuclease [uncultured Bradyrhizobium sp.]|uniref:HNH endonuclease n=1 Tax=uncultured Bradyrhizobium sp. TaxID=199684 RepID=UPI0035CAD927
MSLKRNIKELTLARLRDVLDYDPATGALTWRIRLGPMCKFGKTAGIVKSGYRRIAIDGHSYTASHLAWFHHYGEVPNGLVDHENRDTDDNRIENLRLATFSENARNRKCSALSTTGLKGAARFNSPKNAKRFRSTITIDGRRIHLGQFDTAEEAHKAYAKKAAELHGEFVRTR